MNKLLLATNGRLRDWLIPTVNYATLIVGSLSASLLSRFYFMHGGSSRWVSTWVQSAGFPLLLLPISCLGRSSLDRRLLALSTFVGIFLGINNFLFSWGISYLPVSTSSLLLSSQLAFNLLFSVLLVGQKIRFTNLNCVILLTLSSVLLALGSSKDRPVGVTKGEFFLGFLAILGAGGMFAIFLPVMEMIYRGVTEFRTVVEMQLVMEASATVFATVGMVVSRGFSEMEKEGEEVFDLGTRAYWAVILATVVVWQMVFMGTAGMVFLTSSLNSGICITALLAMNVLGGVVVFGDGFGEQKAVATVLSVWGFASYSYGEYRRSKEEEKEVRGKEMEMVDGEAGEGKSAV